MTNKKTPQEKPDAAERVEAKLKSVDAIGTIIYKYVKKWLLAIVGIGTAISLYLGFDVFNAVGLKNPNMAAPEKVERSMKHMELDSVYFADLEEFGYHTDSVSEYYEEEEDSTAFIQQEQVAYSDDESFEADTVVMAKYLIDAYYDIDMEGDTFYVDIYSDGTDSIYYPKVNY